MGSHLNVRLGYFQCAVKPCHYQIQHETYFHIKPSKFENLFFLSPRGSSRNHRFHLHDTLSLCTLLRSLSLHSSTPSCPISCQSQTFICHRLRWFSPLDIVLTVVIHLPLRLIHFQVRLIAWWYILIYVHICTLMINAFRRPLIYATSLKMMSMAVIPMSLWVQDLTKPRHFGPKEVFSCIENFYWSRGHWLGSHFHRSRAFDSREYRKGG